MSSVRLWLLLALSALSVHCSSDPNPAGTGGSAGNAGTGATGGSAGTGGRAGTGGSAGDAGNGGGDEQVGIFRVQLVPEDEATSTPAFTTVLGRVDDGPHPAALLWTVSDSAGGCELRVPHAPFCDPGCSGTEVCADENLCLPYPTAQDVGLVTMRGVGPTEFTMKAVGGFYRQPADIDLPNPPSAEGATLEVETAGGAYSPFKVQAPGIARLELAGADPLPIESGKALALEWTPGSVASARIQIAVDISHHGGQKGEIDCDVEDSGQFEIPAKLVTGLLELGAAGFPTVMVSRVSTGTTRIEPGMVVLMTFSEVMRDLQIPGIDSCNDNSDCEAGQTCQADRTCK